jgi:hypothetical protein
MDEAGKIKLLKAINSKLTWIVVFLAVIALNTCHFPQDFHNFMQIGPDAEARKDR